MVAVKRIDGQAPWRLRKGNYSRQMENRDCIDVLYESAISKTDFPGAW